jgi:hypothetical protein
MAKFEVLFQNSNEWTEENQENLQSVLVVSALRCEFKASRKLASDVRLKTL